MTDWRQRLEQRLKDRSATIAVLGMGYVGLPLSIRLWQQGFRVLGVDTKEERLAELEGEGYVFEGHKETPLSEILSSGNFSLRSELTPGDDVDVAIICVPTPLGEGIPDLSYLEQAAGALARLLRRGMLVSLESTTYPGTTEGLLKEKLEGSGLQAGTDFALVYSPERIDPGHPEHAVDRIPKLVAGLTPSCSLLGRALYSAVTEPVISLSSPRVAEMAKLMENTYRQVNIALVNEFAMVCNEMDVDVWEALDAAATKPFGFQRFDPGIGIGGHCIAIDPIYLTHRIRELKRPPFRLVELAREIDDSMPTYVAGRIEAFLRSEGHRVEGSTVCLLGVTYKANVPDLRNSRAIEVMMELRTRGCSILFHDPFHQEILLGGNSFKGSTLEDAVASADLVAILTAHSAYDWTHIMDSSRLIFDCRGVTRSLPAGKAKVVLL